MGARQEQNISAEQYIGRKVVVGASDILFPTDIVGVVPETREKVTRLSQEGYGIGLVILHSAKDDLVRPLKTVFHHPVLAGRPAAIPMGKHEHRGFQDIIAAAAGITIQPVINRSTLEVMEVTEEDYGQGYKEYIATCVEALNQGGIALIVPQGGRQSTLGEPEGTPMASFLWRTQKVQKLAFLFMGFRIPGNENYNKRSFHFFEKWQMVVGNILTRDELLQQVPGETKLDKNRNIDAYVFEHELKPLAPPGY